MDIFGELNAVKTHQEREPRFNLIKAVAKLGAVEVVPPAGESIRMISPRGGWSSCALVMAIAQKTDIRELWATSLRVGLKELRAIEGLQIPKVHLCLGSIQRRTAKKYDYASPLEEAAERYGWSVHYANNHSKVILLDTSAGGITIETSSNLNENPQIEQFCVTNSAELLDWYVDEFKRLGCW